MNALRDESVVVSDEVRAALSEGRGVVALETTIVVQGLPSPMNLEVAAACSRAVREAGSVPATVGVLDGAVVVGMSDDQLSRLADPAHASAKLSARDLGTALALGRDGATTVAGTIAVARRVGIDVMATGGLGGVHRDAAVSFDESADLTALSRTSVLVVASGVKSILDIAATLERLDSLGVPVVGFDTLEFPGFYLHSSGYPLEWSVATPGQAAAAFLAHRGLSSSGMLLANPVALERQLDPEVHRRALEGALDAARRAAVSGPAVTPVLLGEFARITGGASVTVNRDLVVANARLAGDVAAAVAGGVNPRRVVVVGDVMLDVVTRPTAPIAATSDTPAVVRVGRGGSVPTSRWPSARAGADVRYVGAAGTDTAGAVVAADLALNGVEPRLMSVDGPTGVVVAIVSPDGQRAMMTDRGVNPVLNREHVEGALAMGFDHLHVSGYTLLDDAHAFGGVVRARSRARARGLHLGRRVLGRPARGRRARRLPRGRRRGDDPLRQRGGGVGPERRGPPRRRAQRAVTSLR